MKPHRRTLAALSLVLLQACAAPTEEVGEDVANSEAAASVSTSVPTPTAAAFSIVGAYQQARREAGGRDEPLASAVWGKLAGASGDSAWITAAVGSADAFARTLAGYKGVYTHSDGREDRAFSSADRVRVTKKDVAIFLMRASGRSLPDLGGVPAGESQVPLFRSGNECGADATCKGRNGYVRFAAFANVFFNPANIEVRAARPTTFSDAFVRDEGVDRSGQKLYNGVQQALGAPRGLTTAQALERLYVPRGTQPTVAPFWDQVARLLAQQGVDVGRMLDDLERLINRSTPENVARSLRATNAAFKRCQGSSPVPVANCLPMIFVGGMQGVMQAARDGQVGGAKGAEVAGAFFRVATLLYCLEEGDFLEWLTCAAR